MRPFLALAAGLRRCGQQESGVAARLARSQPPRGARWLSAAQERGNGPGGHGPAAANVSYRRSAVFLMAC